MKKLFPPGNEPGSLTIPFSNQRVLWMKISITFLLFSILGLQLLMAHDGYGQGLEDETVTLEVKGKHLPDVLHELERQTPYRFAYNEDLISSYEVDLEQGKRSLAQTLDLILKDKPLQYKLVKKKFIVITDFSKRKNVSAATPISITKPSFRLLDKPVLNITGTITDQNGEPLIGVNILVKGTNKGTSTDFDGHFTLEDVDENAILSISYVGYQKQEVSVAGKREINIRLIEDSQTLDEVVVVGYGTTKKESLTSAITTLQSKDIERSVASTTSGALVGKMAGINSRQTDGRPGSSTALQIRNMGNPLYVIDGIQKDAGQFNNLDFNDIKSISVLKDASAAIYGVRAANGVVVVTTKKGATNTENVISVTTNYGLQNLSTFPKPADAVTYVENYIQSETIQDVSNYRYSKEDLEKWRQGTEQGYRPFNWYDYVWETAPQQYLNVNVSGGSEKINYYFSAGHLNQDAMIVNYGGFDRTNVQMNIGSQVTDRLKLSAGLNGRVEHRINPGVPGGDDYWLPRFATYRNLPTVRPFANDNPEYPTLTSRDPGTNFAWLTYDLSGKWEETWRVAQLNFDAEYEILDGLKAKALFGYYYANQQLNNHEYTYKLFGYNEDTGTYPVIFENRNPWRERRMGHVEEVTSNIQLTYNKDLGNHTLALLGGVETITRDEPTTWLHSIPTANSLSLIDYETMDTYNDVGDNTQARLGYMGRINYEFGNRYLLELAARYDGSWKFPPGNRWGFFPSISAGWRISEENFWKVGDFSNIFDDFKLRGSYGILGDDAIGGYAPFDYLSGYNYKSGGSVINGEYTIGTAPRGLPVRTLSWIEAEILDIGIDLGFFNYKLSATLDFFRRVRTGLPASRYDVLLPSEVGFSLPAENLNSDMNMGYDASVTWRDTKGDLNYSIGGNITYSRFYDWDRYKPRFSNSWDEYRFSIEKRFGFLNWGLESAGQFQSWEEISTWPVDNDRQGNETLRPGDVKYVDQNGDGTINWMDERPIGYRQGSTPILNFGLNFSFGWKGFDLAFDLTGGALYTWYQEWEQRNPFHDGGNNPQYLFDGAWKLSDVFDGDSELIPGKYPMLLIGNSGHSNYWNSDFWKKNVKYIKLRNLTFGYSLPEKILGNTPLQTVRLSFTGQNLYTLTNLLGIDPESDAGNGLGYPTMTIYNFGLNVKF